MIEFGRAARIRRLSLLIGLAMFLAGSVAAYEVDTTRVRPPAEPEKKNVGQKLLAVPTVLLDLPIWALEGFFDVVLNDVVMTTTTRRVANVLFGRPRIWGFFPIVSYGSNEGLMMGLSFTSRDVFTKGERFKFTGTYSTNSYRSFSASYGVPKSFGDIGEPYFSLDYQRSPRWSYFGPGNSSDVNDRVAVDLEATVVGLGWHSKVRHHIRADFSAGHGTYNLYDGDDPNREGNLDTIADEFGLPPAEISSSRLWFVGLDLAHDTRNSLGRTTSGGYHKARLSYYHGLSISQGLEFTRANIDLHQFVNVFSSRTLVFRVMAEETWHSDDSPETPFYLNNTLGGAQDLRGFQVRRFEGDDRMLASLEYRYPIWDVVDAFVFFDEGRVFESMSSEFSWRDWHWSSGFGIRMWGSGGVKLVASAGFSNESPQYFFRFSESI